MRLKSLGLLTILIFSLLSGQLSRPAGAAQEPNKTDGYWFFYVFETKVHPQEIDVSSDSPEEKRFYVSNVVLLPDDIPTATIERKVIPYFNDNVVEPAKKHHLDMDFYRPDVMLNGGAVSAIASREAAEEMRKKDIEQRKGQGGNIYSFNIVFGPPKGEPTGQPQLIYRDKGQPSYEIPAKPKGKR
jgi:hypothetical protein